MESTVWKDEDFIAAPGTMDILRQRIVKVWRDEQGRRCTQNVYPDDMTDEEKAAVAEMGRVTDNFAQYRRENPIDKEAMEWAEAEVKRLGLA